MALEDEIRVRMSRYEELRVQMDAVNRQLELLDHLATDKQRARSTLQAVQEGRKGDEVLLPVGGDTFLPVTLADTGSVIIGIGANLATERKVDAALKTIVEDLEALERQLQRVAERSNQLQSEASLVQQEMEALSQEAEREAQPGGKAPRGG